MKRTIDFIRANKNSICKVALLWTTIFAAIFCTWYGVTQKPYTNFWDTKPAEPEDYAELLEKAMDVQGERPEKVLKYSCKLDNCATAMEVYFENQECKLRVVYYKEGGRLKIVSIDKIDKALSRFEGIMSCLSIEFLVFLFAFIIAFLPVAMIVTVVKLIIK